MVSALDRKLLRDLRSLWAPIVTIALVVAAGIGSFVGSLATHDSLRDSRDAYFASSRFADVFASARRAPEAVANRLLALPDVTEVQTQIVSIAQIQLDGVLRPMSARIVSADTQTPGQGLNQLSLRQGHWLEAGRPEVLVHEAFARNRALKPGDSIGALLNGRLRHYTIAGIVLSPEYLFPAAGMGLTDETSFGILWIERDQLEAAFDLDGAFNSVSLKLRSGASLPRALADVDRVLQPYGAQDAFGRADQLSARVLDSEIKQQRVIGILLPVVFVLVTAFILNVVLGRQVHTQRDQIAAMKALGYRDRWIIGYYLKFTGLIVVLGILAGAAIGWWYGLKMTTLYTDFFRFPHFEYRVAAWVVLVPAAVNLFVGLTASLYATRSILKLSPAEAMRPPTPPAFRRTALERLGLGSTLGVTGRMILRNVERRPSRALTGVLGVAGAVAILIAGTWWQDSLDFLIDVNFQRSELAEVQVGFTNAVDASAVRELARLPGVYQAEGMNSAPVRIHLDQRSEQSALIGMPADRTLRQIIGQDERRVSVPTRGVMLGDQLARRLNAMPGDAVRVEFQEGRRRTLTMQVTAVSHEMMGLLAYVDAALLDTLVDEPGTITWAGLMIDRHRMDEFYAEVRRIPRIAVIGVKSAIVTHFRETMARNILFFTSVLTVFATIIAIGVVYNNARISLAERAWELATLRVIGMTEHEVALLLFGELAVELIVALPVGFLFGYGLASLMAGLISTDEFRIPLIIWPRTYAYAGATMLVASVVTAWFVRRRLRRLDLIAVLKTRE